MAAFAVAFATSRSFAQHVDQFGDPLPAGAVKRFGSVRLRGEFDSIAFSPDCKLIVSEQNDTLSFWDHGTGKLVDQWSGPKSVTRRVRNAATAIVYSPDGKLLVCVGERDRLDIWDMEERKVVFTNQRDNAKERITNAVFSPDGDRIATVNDMGQVVIREAASGNIIADLPGPERNSGASDIVFSPDGKLLAATNRNKITLYDLVVMKRLYSITAHEEHTQNVAFISATEFITCGGFRKEIDGASTNIGHAKVWNTRTSALVREFVFDDSVRFIQSLKLIPESSKALAKSLDFLFVFDLRTGDIEKRVPLDIRFNIHPHGMALSPDGKTVAITRYDRVVQIYDLEARAELVQTTVGHRRQPTSMAISPDGKRIASADRGGNLLIWDAETTDLLHEINVEPRDATWLRQCRWSPDGRVVYAVGDRKTLGDGRGGVVLAVRAETGQVMYDISTVSNVVDCDVSNDGKVIAIAATMANGLPGLRNQDAPLPYVELFDSGTGRSLRQFPIEGMLGGVQFTPDGKSLEMRTISDNLYRELRDAESGAFQQKWPITSYSLIHFWLNEQFVALQLDRANQLAVTDVESGKIVHAFQHDGFKATRSMGFAADISKIAAVCFPTDDSGTMVDPAQILVWETATGQVLHKMPDEVAASKLMFSPDGDKLYCATVEGLLYELDLQSAEIE